MQYLIKYWKIILFAVLLCSLFAAIKSCKENLNEKLRFQSNYNTNVNDLQQAVILHKGELAKYYYQLDSLSKIIPRLRTKTIQTVWQTKYNYKDSTLFDLRIKDSINFITVTLPKILSINKPCYDLQLKFEPDTINALLDYHDQLTGFLHWERLHKFWFIRWGVKQYYLKLYSGCQNDTLKVDKLIIIE